MKQLKELRTRNGKRLERISPTPACYGITFTDGGNPSKNNELGCFDLKGRYAGKFKANDGAAKTFGVVATEAEARITLIAPSGEKVFIGVPKGPMSTQERITLGMCLNNATALIAAEIDAENQPQNLVERVFDLTDALYAEYEARYNQH